MAEYDESVIAGAAPAAGGGKPMGFFDHLEELRWTLIKCAVVFALFATIIAYRLEDATTVLDWPLETVLKDFPQFRQGLITNSPMAVFSVIIDLCLIGSVVLSIPFWLFFVGQFVSPALTKRELKVIVPTGLSAFALFLGLHGIARWLRRKREPLPVRDMVHIVALGALATVVGFSWQVIAAIVTGDPGAYLKTELSWRRNWLTDPSPDFFPFEGFVRGAEFWATQWGLPAWFGWVLLVVLVAGIALILLRARAVRRLGSDIRLWSASYLLYLLAVFFPQSSTFRLLMPLTPLVGALAVPRSRAYRWGMLLLCLLLQWLWIHIMYGLAQTYWQVP